MNKRYGSWEAEMKATEPVAGKAFTRERMTAIHRKAVEQAQSEPRRRKRRNLAMLTAVMGVLFVLAGGLLQYLPERDRGEHTPVQTAPPHGQELSWALQPDQMTKYEAFARQPDETWLKGLEPLDIFRWYMRAKLLGDFNTLYGLYVDMEGYEKPSLEQFLSDIAGDPEGVRRGKQMSLSIERDYQLEQRIDGDAALIVMTLNGSKLSNQSRNGNEAGLGTVLEDQIGFGLTKNKAGVWKVNWMPMQ
ncbi:hypothetical protein [Paenibacillus sp. HJGM_3]|uniref:hypothetical protein n=1 Tax=Paenibacillus sp. HJGM_3 TaxID=3379816 RepID=UPI0038594943